jgi:hypothetical protein
MTQKLLNFTALASAALLWGLLVSTQSVGNTEGSAAGQAVISGYVVDKSGPVAGATVRLKAAKNSVRTNASGSFALSVPVGEAVSISAWKRGYYCSVLQSVTAPTADVQLKLIRYQTNDNPEYQWIPPETPTGVGGCSECHNPAFMQMTLKDAHLQSANNPRFLTMYKGTDMEGNQSPYTVYKYGEKIWQTILLPQPPDLSKPYYGPGYVLDFPGTTGNCSACHVPGASVYSNVDPTTVKGADTYGVHCDFCHKVADVYFDPVTRLPSPSFPGVHSMDVRRPFPDDPERPQLFFGTLDDIGLPDTKLPLLQESRYCGACHYGVFWSTVVYNSYGEWLESPYSDPKSGKAKTCQQCHMPSPTVWKRKTISNIAPGKGGVKRQPAAIHSHLTTVDKKLLQNALTMKASATREEGKVVVDVSLTNDKTGHHVPTDSPLRHLILRVDAKDSEGNLLEQVSGPVLPGWCGVGDPARGYYAGLPGKTYAKLLSEMWTNVFPTGAYWNQTNLVSDNRIAAFATDTASFSFVPPESGDAALTVTLLYRRAYIKLMDWKKWDVPDIVMAQKSMVVEHDR